MDNNNPQPAVPPMPSPLTTAQAAPPPAPTTSPQANVVIPGNGSSSGGSKKMVFIIIAILLVAIVALGGWLYLQSNAKKEGAKQSVETSQNTAEINNLDQDLTQVSQINLGDPDQDIATIDAELKDL